jgi:hypothetical protein
MADTMTSHWNETHPGQASQSVASTVADKADDALGAVGSGMTSLAGTLRAKGPDEGVLGTMTFKTAKTLDTAGCYLREEGVRGMAEDVTNLIRRNPGPALLLGLGLGFLLASATKRR